MADARIVLSSSSDDNEEDYLDDVRPSIADQQKVGFFRQDRATQTSDSEIVALKEMTSVIQQLVEDAGSLKRDLNLTKHVMQADYESRLQEKTLELYCRVNDRVTELEKNQDERLAIIRRSFKQQLLNAIVKINNEWKKHYGLKMEQAASSQVSKANKIEEEYKQLQYQIIQQEGVIDMLKMQLQQASEDSQRPEVVTPAAVYEVEGLKEDNAKLRKKILNLENALDTKDENSDEQNKEIDNLSRALEKERVKVEQLSAELEQAKSSANAELSYLKKNAEKQRQNLEKELQEKMQSGRDELLQLARKHANEQQKLEEEKNRLKSAHRKTSEILIQKEVEQTKSTQESTDEISKLKRLKKFHENEIGRLQRELSRSIKSWEKKFTILQKSMYAIKDESYLRQTLQKQAATLHHASVQYSSDTHMGIVPAPQLPPNSPMKAPSYPLPGIGRHGGNVVRDTTTPFTMSPPPNRGVDFFSTGESQIVEPDEETEIDEMGILPLPTPPPQKWPTDNGSSSHQQEVA
ncbi:uncharacterized protein [Antedon mediterranea]|uniref:uncharacterized protein n=1 Tax=Antedon mediterranea TaxID=105859 RepID=UPI003AF9389E